MEEPPDITPPGIPALSQGFGNLAYSGVAHPTHGTRPPGSSSKMCRSRPSRLRPDFTSAHFNLGNLLGATGRGEQAIAEYLEVLRREPGFADDHNNLGVVLAHVGRTGEAAAHFREALRLQPDYADARDNLARLAALLQ